MHEKLYAVELDYPLGHHDKTLLRIGSGFVEPIDDDILIDMEKRYQDIDIESDDDDQSDDGDTDVDDGDDTEGTNDNMMVIVPFN